MSDVPTLSPLSGAELDAVTGGHRHSSFDVSILPNASISITIFQNASGGDSIVMAGNGGTASATGALATGGAGGAATSGIGGAGGVNSITVTF